MWRREINKYIKQNCVLSWTYFLDDVYRDARSIKHKIVPEVVQNLKTKTAISCNRTIVSSF